MPEDEDQELLDAVSEDAESAAAADIDRIDPPSEYLELECGIRVRVLPLRTRQLFKGLRIITHGGANALIRPDMAIDFNAEQDELVRRVVTIMLFSIPDAEQETIDFIQSMVEPADLVDKPLRDLSKDEREHNMAAWEELGMELANPDPQDTITIIENVIRREAQDIGALGKRLRAFLALADKAGQVNAASNGGPQGRKASPGSSPARSTSSRTSTGGRTSTSSTSRSGASGSASRRSPSGTGRRSGSAAR